MKLGWFSRAAVALAASLLSVFAAAQTQPEAQTEGTGNLNIPIDVRFVGNTQPGVRKATAIVNGYVITESDIDHRLALIVASNRIELPPEELQRVRAQVLRNLIDETLQIQAATQQEISVSDNDVNQYYSRFAQGSNRTAEEMSAYLRSIGSSDESLKRQIRGELSWQRVQRRQIEPFVTVGDEEVQAVIDRLNASRGTSEFHVAEIYLSATPETATEARANATRIVQQVRAGASFAAYARQFSEATTAAVGGDLGWVRGEQLPQELSAVVQEMPVGAISDPIQVSGGYSVVALVDKRQILVADPRDAVLSLMQMSIAMPAGTSADQAQGRAQQLAQATQSMGGCGNAAQTAQTIGAELISNDQVRVRELPPALQQTLLNLSIGQASPPFGSAERISVLVLCGRDDPQQASGPSFDQVYAQLNEERVSRRAQRYLRDLRRDAVVDYR
ncbi:peptidylprolyl isomerase [Sphingosinicella sp. LHD-64]|uniref:peptidylprolyl isomerase n=1 Tax=Sphingosinicella sp. LHD-64 TaxID=3072139 RepID=UPI00280EBEE0|nr:peptidylprolyl isomerase [Sphingosinicella sp. LHD-64]MDQ8754998.1 peptidylprolyl isomerase [Sphingosinicella sp. LHD-64]